MSKNMLIVSLSLVDNAVNAKEHQYRPIRGLFLPNKTRF